MKPVLILQHLRADSPAYLGTWLEARGLPFEVRNAEAGQAFPADLGAYGALAILGGEMSANDPLPSLRAAEALVRDALAREVPTLGHCLGGQLMARALGARVLESPAPEIGWQPVQMLAGDAARNWFGAAREHVVFQWHYEAFEVPAGAERLAGSVACPNQAFGIGPHLAMQFHIEIDAAKLALWSEDAGDRYRAVLGRYPTVQDGPTMRAQCTMHLEGHQRLADGIYARWIAAARAAPS